MRLLHPGLKKKHSWRVDTEYLTYTMGLLHGIGLSIDIFTNPKDRILVPTPTYRPFRELCYRSERVMVDYPLGYQDYNFYLDREEFERIAKTCKVILFCSPHNPSGLVFSEDDLNFVLKTALKYNLIVLSDEIHADLVHEGVKHTQWVKQMKELALR